MAGEPSARLPRAARIGDDNVVTLLTCIGRSGATSSGLACKLRLVSKQLDSNLRKHVLNTAASAGALFWKNATTAVLIDIISHGTAMINAAAAVSLCERQDVGSFAALGALLAVDGRRPHCACHPPGEHPSPAEKRGIDATMLQEVFYDLASRATCGIDAFKLLLADARVDPAYDNDVAIRWASTFGHVEIVRALLADERVDPAAVDNAAMCMSSRFGRLAVVNLLLTDNRVDPGADNGFAIRWASAMGHSDVVRGLLAHARVDPAVMDNMPIIRASKNGKADVLRVLLADPRTHPGTRDNLAIIRACEHGQLDAASVLLADGRVDPAAWNNACIRLRVRAMVRRLRASCAPLHRPKAVVLSSC